MSDALPQLQIEATRLTMCNGRCTVLRKILSGVLGEELYAQLVKRAIVIVSTYRIVIVIQQKDHIIHTPTELPV